MLTGSAGFPYVLELLHPRKESIRKERVGLYVRHTLCLFGSLDNIIYTASKVKHRLNISREKKKTMKLSKYDFILVYIYEIRESGDN